MSEILRKIIKCIDQYRYDRRGQEIYKAKNSIAHQYLSIKPMPELTPEDKRQIKDYWSQFGIDIKDFCWFQWYYGVTGIKDPRFIPQDIYSYIIWNHYDNKEFCLAWKDKNYFERFLPDVPFPKCLLRRINGRYYNHKWQLLENKNDVIDCLFESHGGVVIVKDAWDSGEGRGVKKYQLSDKYVISELIDYWAHSENYLVQEAIVQNELLGRFNASSVNTMRINSWRHGNEVEILNSYIRIGVKGQITDVSFIDGVQRVNLCAIKSDGHFGDKVIDQYGECTPTISYGIQPDDAFPRYNDIIAIIKENHKKLDHFDIIGWDFTVDKNGEIICVEYNIKRPGTVSSQYVNGPFFGDHTEDVLAYLREHDNQIKYVPTYMRV